MLTKLVASAHVLSRYSVEGLDRLVVAKRGSKAAVPLGDMTCAFFNLQDWKHHQ